MFGVTARQVAQDASRNPTSTQAWRDRATCRTSGLRGPGATHVDYPTVLVAHGDAKVRSTLVDCLQRNGFHVLEAGGWAHVSYWVREHSRPIHLVLAEASKAELMLLLKQYGSEVKVVFVKEPVDADEVLAKVRQILGSPKPPPSLPSIR